MRRYCKQCQQRGHKKWLWLGTHRTHRFYIRYRIRQARRKGFKKARVKN